MSYETRVKPKPPIDPRSGLPRVKHPLSATENEAQDWWTLGDNEASLAPALVDRIQRLDQMQQGHRWSLALNATLYHGTSSEAFLSNYGLPSVTTWSASSELGGPVHNVVASCVDTLVSKVTQNKPAATFTPKGGDYNQRIRAEGLTDFAAGMFQQLKIYDMDARYATDACLFQAGIIKLTVKDDKIVGERSLRPNLYVDEAEAYYGKPMQMYEKKVITRHQLLAEFPDKEEEILAAPAQAASDFFLPGFEDTTGRLAERFEGWRLPDYEGGDGLHVVCTRSGVLLVEKWKRMQFPFVMLRWNRPTVGYWGDSFVGGLRASQLKINRLDKTIDETMRRMSLGRWMVPNGSKLSPLHLGNQIGSIIKFTGQPPQIDASNTVPSELIAERDAEIQKAHALRGISSLAASGTVPADLKSGEALKVHMDIQTQRFTPFEDAFAKFHLDIAESCIDIVRDLADNNEGFDYRVLLPDRRDVREISWKSVSMKKDEVVIRLSATNYMAGSPEDQIDKATTFSQAAGLDIVETIDAIQVPDIETAVFPKTAPLRWLRWAAYQMSRKGRQCLPTEITDLVHGIPLMKAVKQQLEVDGAPQDRQDLFEVWLTEAVNLQNKVAADQAALAAQNAPPGTPTGAPMPPPPSQLRPFKQPHTGA
jgi:hypothetical protein